MGDMAPIQAIRNAASSRLRVLSNNPLTNSDDPLLAAYHAIVTVTSDAIKDMADGSPKAFKRAQEAVEVGMFMREGCNYLSDRSSICLKCGEIHTEPWDAKVAIERAMRGTKYGQSQESQYPPHHVKHGDGPCSMCGNPATHKVGEEIHDDDPELGSFGGVKMHRHNFTNYVCCTHFRAIMGDAVFCPKPVEEQDEPPAVFHCKNHGDVGPNHFDPGAQCGPPLSSIPLEPLPVRDPSVGEHEVGGRTESYEFFTVEDYDALRAAAEERDRRIEQLRRSERDALELWRVVCEYNALAEKRIKKLEREVDRLNTESFGWKKQALMERDRCEDLKAEYKGVPCVRCNGSGEVWATSPTSISVSPCPQCKGLGCA